ncbi:hypothetical protein [Anaerotruncus colihominis]|uniref:hypothetical protein n=1 Tax=Anaerotruncus colihominis TaxID=169435 RepID=UPI0024301A83|nr:hypothetical protein [Anaerotruncus colihominis]
MGNIPQPKPALPVSLPLCGRQARMGLLLWYNNRFVVIIPYAAAKRNWNRKIYNSRIVVGLIIRFFEYALFEWKSLPDYRRCGMMKPIELPASQEGYYDDP